MRSRITGRRLLPVALAAATVTAPAAALAAPPPEPGAQPDKHVNSTEDCAGAVKVLSQLKLLPEQASLDQVLCSRNQAKPDQSQPGRDDYTDQIDSSHTTSDGRTVEEHSVLGTPVKWPRSLTVQVPTVNERLYTYSAKGN